MAATSEDVYKVLQSIDSSLKALVAHFGAGARSVPGWQGAELAAALPTVASDRDLDGEHGNPEIRTKDPRNWTGDPMRGKRFSECSPEYLDQYAEFLDWMQTQAETPAKARYKQLDASRARGWAARKRNGWTPPPEETSAFGAAATGGIDASDIPF